MKRHYYQPRPILRNIVKTIEILDLPDVVAQKIGNRFLPDGYFEIGFNLGSDQLKITSTATTDIQLQNPVGYFLGQCSVSSQLLSTGRIKIMIVKIFPWAASLFFDFDLADCTDINLDLEEVLGKEIQSLEDNILAANQHQDQINLLQDYLIAKLHERDKTRNPLLEHATTLLFQFNGNIKMKDLAVKAHSTPRTIQRTFRQYYGITAKQFAQQLRLRHFATQLAHHPNLSLTQLAIHCGYFDQAHFNHEFKSIVKTTPSEFFFANTPLVDDFLQSV